MNEFEYLRSTVLSNGERQREVEKRVQAERSGWRRVSRVIGNRRVPATVKGKV